ncbi:MAG: hypothetical protein ABW223_07655 [Rariglobus sp.]
MSLGDTGATVASLPSSPPSNTIDPDALIERYSEDEKQNPKDIRRGCLIVFAAALGLLTLGVTAIWWFGYR